MDVQQGRVQLEDQVGNAEADAAADLGRCHQSDVLIDARRRLLQSRSYDGRSGTAPDLLVWDPGGPNKASSQDDDWSHPAFFILLFRVAVSLPSYPSVRAFWELSLSRERDKMLFRAIPPSPLLHVRELPEFSTLMALIVAIGLVACYGMAGCQDLVMVKGTLGRPLLEI